MFPRYVSFLSFRVSVRREASALGVHTGVGIRIPGQKRTDCHNQSADWFRNDSAETLHSEKRNKPRPADGVYSFSDGQRPCYNLHSSQVGRLRPTLLLPTSARKGRREACKPFTDPTSRITNVRINRAAAHRSKLSFGIFSALPASRWAFRAPARVTFGRSPKSDQKVCLKPKVSRLPARYARYSLWLCTARSRGFSFVVRIKGLSLRLRRCRWFLPR